MSKEKKISIAIVLSTFLLTVFFLYESLFLTINGDFTRFFPWDEMDDVYYVESKEEREIEIKSAEIKSDYIFSSDYKTGLNASSSPLTSQEEKDYPYTSSMYVLVAFPDLRQAQHLEALENCIDEIDKEKCVLC